MKIEDRDLGEEKRSDAQGEIVSHKSNGGKIEMWDERTI